MINHFRRLVRKLLIAKSRGTRASIVGGDIRSYLGGFIDTTEGAVLTSELALGRASENASPKTMASIKEALVVKRRALRPAEDRAQNQQ